MIEAFESWTRLHQTKPSVTLEIAKGQSDTHYMVAAKGWPIASHFARAYQFL